MPDLSTFNQFQLSDIEMLHMLPFDKDGRCMEDKIVLISRGPLCMAALEPDDVLVAALQADVRSISLLYFWPGWLVEITEEDTIHKIRLLFDFYLEVVKLAKPLGITVLDYEMCGDPYAKEVPFISFRRLLLGKQPLSYYSSPSR